MLLRCLAILILFQLQGVWFAAIDKSFNNNPSHDESTFPYFEVNLDPDDKLHLYWTVDYEEETVTFELRVRSSEHDWVGVGFSDRGEIKNADLCVLWTDKKRKNKFQVNNFLNKIYRS